MISDENAKIIFLASGMLFGMLCGTVAAKFLIKGLTYGKVGR